MNTNIHNKKRNSMLMYEFLIRTVSKALAENNKKKQQIALSIIKRCFKPGTELHKEFRLANALYKTTVKSDSTASSILDETKNIVRSINIKELNKEKSILIREVNYRLNDETFYDQQVSDYRVIATIQTLFNEWQNINSINIEKLAEYEDKMIEWLLTNKITQLQEQTEIDSGTTRIVSKLINQKFNQKYVDVLTTEQKSIIRAFVLNENNSINEYLSNIKQELLNKLNVNVLSESNEQYNKLLEVKQTLINENVNSSVDIDMINRFLLYSKLVDDLQEVRGTNE